jgi:GntR family transcriptional regulator, trigonelline degradation regulator
MNDTGYAADIKLIRRPTSVRQIAAETVRHAILTGRLAPGERIIENTFAKQLGISRSSLREALTQLAAEKLISFVPNRGPAVAVISWSEAENIYGVRKLLEGEAAAECAQRCGQNHIKQMRMALRDFARAIPKNAVGLLETTTEFYEALLDGSGNPVISDILRSLNARISVLRARSMSQPDRPPQSLAEMTAILEAIERRDAKAARAASSRHVEHAAAAAQRMTNAAEA